MYTRMRTCAEITGEKEEAAQTMTESKSKAPHSDVSIVQAGLEWPPEALEEVKLLQSSDKPIPVSIWMPRPVGSKIAERPLPRIGLLPQVWNGFFELT